jgi:chromosome segregation ATPase
MAPRLKVFVTSDGLTDYVVAVSSKAKAMAAWGIRQDVFKEGQAHEVDDPELVKAATARPGEVLRRPAGTRGELAKLKPAKPPKAAKPAGPSKAALKKVADLEARLAGLDTAHEAALAKLEAQRAALERRIDDLREQQTAERRRIEAALSEARQALG